MSPSSRVPLHWRPSRHLWVAVGGGVLGSATGLLFGIMSLNRPLANAAVFYVLGFGLGALLAGCLSVAAGRRAGGGATAEPDRTRRPHDTATRPSSPAQVVSSADRQVGTDAPLPAAGSTTYKTPTSEETSSRP